MSPVQSPCFAPTLQRIYACRFITAYFPRDNMCYITANEIPRAHGKSTTVTRRSLPPSERLARETTRGPDDILAHIWATLSRMLNPILSYARLPYLACTDVPAMREAEPAWAPLRYRVPSLREPRSAIACWLNKV